MLNVRYKLKFCTVDVYYLGALQKSKAILTKFFSFGVGGGVALSSSNFRVGSQVPGCYCVLLMQPSQFKFIIFSPLL